VILVHYDRDVRVGFDGGIDEVAQEGFPRIFAGACRGLHDHGAVQLAGGFHDGLNLFQVVDVESGQAIAEFCRVIKQLAHGDECHE